MKKILIIALLILSTVSTQVSAMAGLDLGQSEVRRAANHIAKAADPVLALDSEHHFVTAAQNVMPDKKLSTLAPRIILSLIFHNEFAGAQRVAQSFKNSFYSNALTDAVEMLDPSSMIRTLLSAMSLQQSLETK